MRRAGLHAHAPRCQAHTTTTPLTHAHARTLRHERRRRHCHGDAPGVPQDRGPQEEHLQDGAGWVGAAHALSHGPVLVFLRMNILDTRARALLRAHAHRHTHARTLTRAHPHSLTPCAPTPTPAPGEYIAVEHLETCYGSSDAVEQVRAIRLFFLLALPGLRLCSLCVLSDAVSRCALGASLSFSCLFVSCSCLACVLSLRAFNVATCEGGGWSG